MNKLLKRQIEKFLGALDSTQEGLKPLFQAISDTYDGFDADRNLMERSLDISSDELTEINQRLGQEITVRKRAEEKLKDSVSLLTATLQATADGILVVDKQGRIRNFNEQFEKLWRIPMHILESKNQDDVLTFCVNQLIKPEALITEMSNSDNESNGESFNILELKDERVFEGYSKPQFLGDKIIGRVLSFRDVTMRNRAQQRQVQLIKQIKRANRELANFTYVASHDLKVPLRGIKTLADWILTDYAYKFDDEGKEKIGLLLTRVDRMHNLIEGILQYSRIERVKEEKVKVNLNELVSEIINKLAPPKNVTIAVENELPIIKCEQTRIAQVFQSLLDNAIKYVEKPQGLIKIDCVEEDGFWKFSVSDNGPGIEEKYFDKIFRMFQTLSPWDRFNTTGVGLTVAKKIIELQGGKIWVESNVGQGSTFLFTLSKKKERVKDEKLQTSSIS